MAAYVRWNDATWKTINSGKLAVKWGSGWVYPTAMQIKADGVWRNSGYVGYPAVPVSTAIYSWDYANVRISWGAGAGGAPVAAYHIVQTDSAGNWLRQYEVTGSPSANIPVSPSSYYIFYVRAKSVGGQYSDWGPTVRAKIGKAAVTTYTTEYATRAWSNGQGINSYKDISDGCIIPSSVKLTHVRFVIYANQGFTSILCPYNNRQIYAIHNGGLGGQFNWQATSIDQTHYWDYTGNGGITGLRCAGTGWSIYSTGLQRALGNVYAYGNETYSYQQAHTTPAVANSYW